MPVLDNADECHILDLIILFLSLSYLFSCCFVLCDQYFIPSLSYIGNQLKLSSDIQGATLMAIGSSTPEFFTSLIAIILYSDNVDLNPAPWTIVGSGMFNVSFVIGLYVIISNVYNPSESNQNINSFALHRDIGAYIISVIALYIFYDVSSPKHLSGVEGMCLIFIWIIYVIILSHSYRCVNFCQWHKLTSSKQITMEIVTKNSKTFNQNEPNQSVDEKCSLIMKFYNIFYSRPIHGLFSYLIPIQIPMDNESDASEYENVSSMSDSEYDYLSDFPLPNEKINEPIDKKHKFFKFCSLFCLSIIWMSVITYFLLSTVTAIGNCLNISAQILGITVIAIGSSLPDTLTSFILAKKYGNDKIDMIISNCFSSNVFNICFIMGMTFLLKDVLTDYGDEKNNIDTEHALGFMLIQIFTSLLFLVLMHLNSLKLKSIHGCILISMYFIFVILFVVY